MGWLRKDDGLLQVMSAELLPLCKGNDAPHHAAPKTSFHCVYMDNKEVIWDSQHGFTKDK